MKKLILLFSLALIIVAAAPAQAIQLATVFNPETGHRKAVVVGDPNAFDDGYILEIAYGYIEPEEDSELLGYSVVTDYQTTLSSSMTSSQATIPVSKVTTQDDHTLTMGDLGSKVFFVIEPGARKEEIVMCTSISGTTWGGCTRGLAFYGTSTVAVAANRETHNSGSTVVMSNVHYATDESVDKDSKETIAGVKTFTATTTFTGLPILTTYIVPTDDKQMAAKKYVDDVALASAPDATETVKGVVELGTQSEIASTTSSGSAARLVIPGSMATSSPQVRGLYIPVAENDGYLNQGWLDLTENFAFSGDNTFSATSTMATTTIDKLTINDLEVSGDIKTLTASSTIAGATLPVAVYIDTTTEAVNACDGNDTDTLTFIGFAISDGTNGSDIDVQTGGIVNGFTGLTRGAKYYVQDDKTIGTSIGSYEVLVGIAISETELIILKINDLTNMFSVITTTGDIDTDTTVVSANTERSTASATYVKLKETRIGITTEGDYNVSFSTIKDAGGTGKAQIYKNGVAAGTERTVSASYVQYQETLSVLQPGDLIQLYAKDNTSTTYVKDFKVSYTKTMIAESDVITD